MSDTTQVLVIGAGIGGLTTAAVLAKAGLDVTVLEAHIYPGGCAGTFYHQQYRFDAGATLAGGFYPGGPMDLVGQAAGVDAWPVQPSEPSMVVHLPDGSAIPRWSDERRWDTRRQAFGAETKRFWHWQERTADLLWDLALRKPSWPPQSPSEAGGLVGHGLAWLGKNAWQRNLSRSLPADVIQPVAAHLRNLPENLRLFVDAQLLIASQATSARTNALYGASALDLPRRGVVHVRGGIGALSETLADAVRRHGGNVEYRSEVTRLHKTSHGTDRPRYTVETKRNPTYEADIIIANLPPWNIAQLMGDEAPQKLRTLPEQPQRGGGAFMVYVGVDAAKVPESLPLHHQVIVREPMGEGNTLFLSLSPAWDETRAPSGQRALTISTHTSLQPWWTLLKHDPARYEQRKSYYSERLLSAAERVIPGLHEASLIKPGTPVTFQRFTRRAWGWVGGFPQTNLWQNWGPRLDANLWMVGDTIFPGQSMPAVALGGLRVAHAVLANASVHSMREASTAVQPASTD